ncbi:MAG: sulfite reductase subunit alpha [Verrucomicrobiae bacterium]|nr:sulfite reductase subunit alpha [Verrucomicrobiae bacterium]
MVRFLQTKAAKVDPAYDKNNPYLACLSQNRQLNREGSAKDTRHLVVDLGDSGIEYSCGDSLGVYPLNRAEEVEEIITAMDLTGEEKVVIPRTELVMTFRKALFSAVSLAGPTRRTLMAIAEEARNPEERARLAELLQEENKLATAVYLENRHFIDLLEEFPSARFSPQEFIDSLRKLMPRLYSIASSPTRYPAEVHLTVAVVRYETNGRERHGVCSTFLADRVEMAEGKVPVFVAKSHFSLPEDSSTPMIMVGPGTGIAPFRAFLQERIDTGATGRNWLFFGDRHQATDYLYGEEFEAMKAEGHLQRLDLAWSRDQEHKVYVQDKMLESGTELWSWLQEGAYFYVCGDAKRMAKDVDTALHTIAMEQGGLTGEDAEAYLKVLKKEKRYQRDVY